MIRIFIYKVAGRKRVKLRSEGRFEEPRYKQQTEVKNNSKLLA
jgi:hypothetical protein